MNNVRQNIDNPTQWTTFSKLESGTKYCLIDTVVLLPLYWKNQDMISDIRREAQNSTVILLNSIARETYLKNKGLDQ